MAKHAKVLGIIKSTESRAACVASGLSSRIRGNERPTYSDIPTEKDDKRVGYLLRNISEQEREDLKEFTASDLAKTYGDSLVPTMQRIKEQLEAIHGPIRGGRWHPRASFRERVDHFHGHKR